MSENTENVEEQTCDMCKISYVTEKELRDHEWSLMHHIKVEQRKKGSTHKCSLCFTTCPNLIEYGKHLNGDKHKQAIEEGRVQRETLDPQEIHYRLQSGEKEVEQEEPQEPVRVETSYNREVKAHQRSYSQPQFRGQYYGNRRPYRNRPSQFYEYEEGYNYRDSFENPHWHRGGMRQMFPYQWQQPWEPTSPDPWEHPSQDPEDMDFQFQEKNRTTNYRQSGDEYSKRERNDRFEFVRPERDRSELDVDKRRMQSDNNKKAVRFEDESEETSGYSSQPQITQESISTKRRRKNTDVDVDQPSGARTTKNSKNRSHDFPVVEADSTTDIEMLTRKPTVDAKKAAKIKKKKGTSSKNSPRSEEGSSVLERAEKLCKELRDKREKAKKDLHSKEKEKKVEKNDEINKQLAKFAEINKSYVKGVLDDTNDTESSITLSTVQSSKTDKISSSTPIKQKINQSPGKSKDKTDSSPKSRSNKTSSPSRSSRPSNKGKESMTCDNTTSDVHSSSKYTGNKDKDSDTSKPIGGKRKSKDSPNKTENKTRDINEIRREIELEVQKSQIEHEKSFEHEQNESLMKEEKKSVTHDDEILEKRKTSSEELTDDSTKSRSVIDSTSRESLLKMVNSPRSRKERQQLAEVLRTYAKSQNRLSLPRFNLHMSGIYDNLEHYGEFRLEELSPDVQLQIAELIEADIKPDIDDLEKTLLSDIKVERERDEYVRLSRSPSVDRLEMLDKSLNQSERADIFDLKKMDDLNRLRLSSSDIKKEPIEAVQSPVKYPESLQYSQDSIQSPARSNYPKSPQYSQEEREFIEQFCAPGSSVINSHTESPQEQTRRPVYNPQEQTRRPAHSPHKQVEDVVVSVNVENKERCGLNNSHIQSREMQSSPKTRSPNISHIQSREMQSSPKTCSPNNSHIQSREMQSSPKTCSPNISHIQSREMQSSPKTRSPNIFRARSNSLSSIQSIGATNFSDSLRSNPESHRKKQGIMDSMRIESWSKPEKREIIPEQLMAQASIEYQRNSKASLTNFGSNMLDNANLTENKMTHSFKTSCTEPISVITTASTVFGGGMSSVRTSQTDPPIISTGSAGNVQMSSTVPVWFSSEMSPYVTSQNELLYSAASREKVQPSASTSAWFDGGTTSCKTSQNELLYSAASRENVQPSASTSAWFDGGTTSCKTSQNELLYSAASRENVQPSASTSAWFDGGTTSCKTSQNSTGSEEKILTYAGMSSSLFGRTTQTEPFYAGGNVALTNTTTVTTWSMSSGYMTQPQAMSSSEMSLSSASISHDIRRPSETSTAESLVDTVYDISIKEEDARQELQDVDQNISRLQKLIEESTIELKKYKEKKLTLKREEENLRSKRINVLQEARDKQRRPDSRLDSDISDRPTPPLSGTEDYGMSSGVKTMPTSIEDSGIPLCIRQRTDHRFSNPLYPSDESDLNIGRSRPPATFSLPENHGIPSGSRSRSNNTIDSPFDPYILKGMQTLNTIQSKSEYHNVDTHRQLHTETMPQMMPPPSMSPMKMSPNSQGSNNPNQRKEPLMDNNQMKTSGIQFQSSNVQVMNLSPATNVSSAMNMSSAMTVSSTENMPSAINELSAANLSSANHAEQKQISDLENQTDLSTSYIKFNKQVISDRIPDQQQPLDKQTPINDTKPDKIFDNRTRDISSEDVIMMSDDQKHGDVIIIHDSPKQSKSRHSTWVAAEKPDSESQSTPSKHSSLAAEGQLRLHHYETQKQVKDVTRQGMSPTHHIDSKTTEIEHTSDSKQYNSEPIEHSKHYEKDHMKYKQNEEIDVPKSTNLQSFGFVTLSNLMNSDLAKSPKVSSVNSPRKEELGRQTVTDESEKISCSEVTGRFDQNEEKTARNDETRRGVQHEMSQKSSHVEGDNSSSQTKQISRFPRSEDGLRSVGSDTEDSSVRQVHDNKDRLNVQYMGSLPHGTDRSELLKQFKARRDDRMSFLVVDGDQNKDMYAKLQSLLTKPPSGSSHQNKEEVSMDLEEDSGLKDSNYESINSNCSLGEKIRQYCNQNKSEKTEPIMLSDEEQQDDTGLIVRENLPSQNVEERPSNIEERRSSSPFRKRLKTKKERDRTSIRKQKEGCILESSSDYNSAEDDIGSKYGQKSKGGQKYKHFDVDITSISDIKDCDVDKISQDRPEDEAASEVMTHRLLEEVQLETESDDSRILLKDKFAERFKLKPDFLASLKAAVKSSLAKDTTRVKKPVTLPDNRVHCCGPKEQVSGIQIVGPHIFVSYIGMSVRKFHSKTGELLHTFDCTPHQISCLYILKTNDSLRLYTGGSSQHLLSFNALTGQPLRSENLEEKLQCFHHNWGKLFIGTFTGSILVWSTKTDRNIDAYVCSDRPISCISSATEGAQKVILVAAYDSTVFVLSATSGLLIRILEGHTKTVFSLQVDGSVVFSGSGDKTVIEHNLQTGDVSWTYTQAAGIITVVFVYEDLLFCASFDKLIRCYTREDHKLKSLFYGAERGLVTQMTVVDDKIITGNRNGTVEISPINRDKESVCQFEGCSYVFGVKHHLLYHVMSDHVMSNTKMFRCLWKGCKDWLSTKEGQQEAENHMIGHIME